MATSSKQCTNCCASKALYSANTTAHAVSSVARSTATNVEKLCPSQKWNSRGGVDVLVSKVIFQRPTPKISVAILERQSLDENYSCG